MIKELDELIVRKKTALLKARRMVKELETQISTLEAASAPSAFEITFGKSFGTQYLSKKTRIKRGALKKAILTILSQETELHIQGIVLGVSNSLGFEVKIGSVASSLFSMKNKGLVVSSGLGKYKLSKSIDSGFIVTPEMLQKNEVIN